MVPWKPWRRWGWLGKSQGGWSVCKVMTIFNDTHGRPLPHGAWNWNVIFLNHGDYVFFDDHWSFLCFFLNYRHFRTPPSGIAYDKASAASAGFPDKSFNESCRCCASFDLRVVMERKQLSFWSKMMRTSPCENDQETSTEGFMMIYDDQATGIFTRGKVIGG